MQRTITVLLLILTSTASLRAADYYILPQAAGSQNASDWKNAAPPVELRTILADTIKPGDRILLGSGTYRIPRNRGSNTVLPIPRSGAADAPIRILGVDTGSGHPTIVGRWSEENVRYHAHCYSCFSFAQGVSHVTIEDLNIIGFMHAITTSGSNSHLKFKSLSIERCREGFILDTVTDSIFEDCNIRRYTKRGVRFQTGCSNLTLTRVLADATAGDDSWPIENYPFGFSIESDRTNRGIRYIECTSRNNLHRRGPHDYWNGDGFTAEKGVSGVSYRRCLAVDNMDGGWDDKSTAPTLIDCIAVGNKRAIRIWNAEGDAQHPARLINCIGAYSVKRGGIGSTAGLWTCGHVVAERCTFHNNPSAAVSVYNNGRTGHAVLRNCILSRNSTQIDSPLIATDDKTTCRTENTVQYRPGTDTPDPNYLADNKNWKGRPRNALNSRRHAPSKGACFPPNSPTNSY